MSAIDPRRLEAVERALGLPRRVPLMRCAECAHELAEIRKRARADRECPRCGFMSLRFIRTVSWPPPADGRHVDV